MERCFWRHQSTARVRQPISNMSSQDIQHLLPGPLLWQGSIFLRRPLFGAAQSLRSPWSYLPEDRAKSCWRAPRLWRLARGCPGTGSTCPACQQTAELQSTSLIPEPCAAQIGCLFLGLDSCRDKAASFPLLREQFVLIGVITVPDL